MHDGAADERAAPTPAEGALLWSTRAWVLARLRTEDLQNEERIKAAMDGLDAAEAGCGLCRFMGEVKRAGIRPVIVERMCARFLMPDERALLGIFACAGAGRAVEAARTLRNMIRGPAIRHVLGRAALAPTGRSLTVLH